MKYRFRYHCVNRERESVIEPRSRVIEADSDRKAFRRARALIRGMNRVHGNENERFELLGVSRIVTVDRK